MKPNRQPSPEPRHSDPDTRTRHSDSEPTHSRDRALLPVIALRVAYCAAVGTRDALTESEQRLIEHVTKGTFLDFVSDDELDSTSMPSWGANRTIRATVIRDILLGRLAATPDPLGLQLRGAKISGRLNLTHVKTDIPVRLVQCFFDEGMEACDAQIPALMLAGSCLSNESISPLDVSGLNTAQAAFNQLTIIGNCSDSGVRLVRARISGSVGFSGATIRNTKGPAIRADGLLIERNLVLNKGFAAEGVGDDAAVRLVGAVINGEFICTNATIQNKSGPALAADKIHVGQSANLVRNFTAIGNGEDGAVRLAGAIIGDQLSLSGAVLHNDSGPALIADRIQVQDSMHLRNGFKATGSGKHGTLVLPGARIGGDLLCADAKLENPSGPALAADGVQIEQDLEFHHVQIAGEGDRAAARFCDAQIGGKLGLGATTFCNNSGPAFDGDRIHVRQGVFAESGLRITASSQYGAVRLIDAKIDAGFQCTGTIMFNGTGSALLADGMHVTRSLELSEGFTAIGNSSSSGAVQMLGAQIGGQIQLLSASLENRSGSALAVDRIHVAGNVVLTNNCSVTGTGDHGTIRLLGARIDGQLTFDSTKIHNNSGPAVLATEMQVNQSLILSRGLDIIGAGNSATLNLASVKVGGLLVFDPGRLEHKSDTRARLHIDGLTYSGLPATPPDKDWLEVIRSWTRTYSAQPYRQLATAHGSIGHDNEAKKVLMTQRRDQISRSDAKLHARLWAWMLRVTLGYGYKPGRALWWFAGVVIVAALLTLVTARIGGIAVIDSAGSTSPCSAVEQIGVAVDISVPLIDPGSRNSCQVTVSTAGQVLTAAGWVLQLLAWAFTTLFVAGFTGVVRKI